MNLAIVSHTEHYKLDNGQIVGWGATVREINFLAKYFDNVYHLACLHNKEIPESALPYDTDNIHFLPLPPTGGKTFSQKITVISKAPEIWKIVKGILPKVDFIQLRLPTGMGNYLLPLMTAKRRKPITWVKYAGNWAQENPPLGYRFQRWWLTKNFLNCPVTINGKWPNQPTHCYTFENPCLDNDERLKGLEILKGKCFTPPYIGIFIGRLETQKGVRRIIEALDVLERKGFGEMHFVGDGVERQEFEMMVAQKKSSVKVFFHGGMSRLKLVELMEVAHCLILPSNSEGFPKVVAECCNYGVLPIVSDVGSIPQYINESNGYVWPLGNNFSQWLEELPICEEVLKIRSQNAYQLAYSFTFENYYNSLMLKVLRPQRL